MIQLEKPKLHYLKTWPEYFNDVVIGIKQFELRKNDRDFKVGDYLLLRDWNPDTKKYSGRQTVKAVTYILKGGNFGLEDGFVIMGIRDPNIENEPLYTMMKEFSQVSEVEAAQEVRG